jgi:hypothetical protein
LEEAARVAKALDAGFSKESSADSVRLDIRRAKALLAARVH